ncbi:C6 zinc cluster transcription factor-like protein [Savitreella phatthalungensis]
MLEVIYITRHGFRTNWENTKWSPSPTGIDRDPPLSSYGVAQAQEMANHLQKLDPRIDRIYCSPFYRCLQTIKYTSEALNLPIHVDNGIGEWYGVTTGRHPSPASKQKLKTFFPTIDVGYEPSLIPTTKGETMADIHERVKRAMELVVQDAERNDCKAIVLCTHAATNIALGRALTGEEEMDVQTGTCSLGRYERRTDSSKVVGGWRCTLNGDCSFLTGGEERNWSFDGDIPVYENDKANL